MSSALLSCTAAANISQYSGQTPNSAPLIFVPAIAVPAGFTRDGLPAGITFMGRPYADGAILRLAYAYEQATHHRRPPASTS